jgi:hypothetical protein
MSVSGLPTQNLLGAYWLDAQTTDSYPAPTARNILAYTRNDGTPQINVVYLAGCRFAGTQSSWQEPYLYFSPSLMNTLQNGVIKQLQAAGTKVILCVMGNGNPGGLGWQGLTDAQAEQFAAWVNTNVIQEYGLDGIDIDDEWAKYAIGPQQLVNTAAWLRATMPNMLLTKALWQDTGYGQPFSLTATSSSLSGQTLAQLLSFGSTMGYGWGYQQQISNLSAYTAAGMPYSKLCIGVQPGPVNGQWMTPLSEVQQLAIWTKQNGLLGMMMWSFSQDILEFTNTPQYGTPYMSAGDHSFQQAIINQWGVGYNVDAASLMGIYFPEGGFAATSSSIRLTLTADLQNEQGTYIARSVDIIGFDNADLSNINGAFVKTETMLPSSEMQSIAAAIAAKGLGTFVPVGSWFKSARNIKVTLSATCLSTSGLGVQSTLDLTTVAYDDAIVENINGVLTLAAIKPAS